MMLRHLASEGREGVRWIMVILVSGERDDDDNYRRGRRLFMPVMALVFQINPHVRAPQTTPMRSREGQTVPSQRSRKAQTVQSHS